MPDSVPLGTSL